MKYSGLILSVITLIAAPEARSQSDDSEDSHSQLVLEEVIVTVRKMGEESTLDLSMSTSIVTAEIIDKRFLDGMNDYLRYLPGTNYIDRGTSRNSVIFRGITADPQRGRAITGIYIDETPMQGLGAFETGSVDLGLVDVERVEVLRGPQGTLYGAGSMSGMVRTLTRAPDLNNFGGDIQLGVSVTSGAGDFNNDIQAVLNLPLAKDVFAIRAVAYRFEKSGYINNVGYQDPAKQAGVEFFGARLSKNVEDRGNRDVKGFRFGALWRVTENLDIRFTAMGQDTDQDGLPTADTLQGPSEQSRYARLDGSDERLKDDLELYSLVINYSSENWSLVSASSWTDYSWGIDYDVSLFFLDAFEGEVEPPFWIFQSGDSEVFTQEIRWAWDAGGRWRILAGVFYEDADTNGIDSTNYEGIPESDPFEGFFDRYVNFEGGGKRTSFFGDFSYGVSEHWEVTAGARHYNVKDGESGHTLKAGVNWRPETRRLGEAPLIYAVWSEGFRPGFKVESPPPRCDPDGDGIIDPIGLPWKDIESDDLESLELGFKSTFRQQRIAVEAAVFKIDWDGIPIDIPIPLPCAFTLPFNAGSAESKGLEFALSALLTDALQFNLSGSWTNAKLVKSSPGLGEAGDRLPGSPKFNMAAGLEYGFSVYGHTSWARGDLAYVGDYYGTLQEDPPKAGDYFSLNLGTGIDFKNWSLEFFVNNLTNENNITWADPIWNPYPRLSLLRPRTIGARLGYNFDK